jgi:hypothetical protein
MADPNESENARSVSRLVETQLLGKSWVENGIWRRTDDRNLSGRAGNTNTARPPIDRAFESVCDRCGFFETGPKFLTVLKRQRNHAEERGQNDGLPPV